MRFLILANLLFLTLLTHAQGLDSGKPNINGCLSETEKQLSNMINSYRAEKHLSPIELSVSLCKVALVHCHDLAESSAYSGKCNLHSWSVSDKWSSCCYTPDHKQASCMWNKPRELTSYTGDGFEIAFFTTASFNSPTEYAKEILNSWKKSPGHNEIIINQGKWDDLEWKAMGVGIWQGYTTVWFGKDPDPAGKPEYCN